MRAITTIHPARPSEIASRINAYHALAERERDRCNEAVYEALHAAWQAGRLLLQQKRRVGYGNWVLWLQNHFNGSVRTAQRYMALAKGVPDVSQLRDLTLRQAYLRLGTSAADASGESAPSRRVILPVHARLANRFHRWTREKGDIDAMAEQDKRTLQRDLRPLYEWLGRLYTDSETRSNQ
jgi:hypothetical protein